MTTILISIITAAITALLTTVIKSMIDQFNYKNKLQKDLEFEQQRSVKNTVSKYKGQLVDSISSLHHRLKHLAREEGYSKLNNKFVENNDEFLKSSIYRFLSVFAHIHIINQEIIHFDPTKAHEDELVLMKYFKIFPLVFQDKDLEENMSKTFTEKSLIPRNTFEEMYKWLIVDKSVISYSDFLKEYDSNEQYFLPINEYLLDLKPDDSSTRWDRLFTLHILLMSFLNKFGYDFQHTDEENIKKYISRQSKYGMFNNIEKHLIHNYKLEKADEIKSIIKITNSFIK